MSHLLDTNVVSEWTKPRPNPGVIQWLSEVDEDRVFLSVVSVAEIRFGIERLPQTVRRARLASWLEDELIPRFDVRLLDINRDIAQGWGMIMARAQASGLGLSSMDGLLAATAERRGLTLVTRNTKDFLNLGIDVLDIWREGEGT